MLSKSDVEHIAKLARLELSSEDKEKYQAQLDKVLDYVDQLKEVKTNGVATADGGTRDLHNIWRHDNNQGTINNKQGKELVNMAPDKENQQIKVKSVF